MEMTEYAINDKVIADVMVTDLMENYGYNLLEAKRWVQYNGDNLISKYMEDNAECKGSDDD